MSARYFYALSIAFFAGVFVSSVFDISQSVFAALVLLAAALAWILGTKDGRITLCIVSVVAFSFGLFRMETSKGGDRPLDKSVDDTVALTGFVCSEPEAREAIVRFCFEPAGEGDRILVTVGRYPLYLYGDVLSIEGKLRLPANFQAREDGPTFDYVSYLAKDDIRYTMFRPQISKIGEGGGSWLLAGLFSVKRSFVENIKNLFPEPQSSLLGGLLLGDRSSLPSDVIEEFRVSGLVHVLVLSGYNVTIVAESLMKAFSFLPRALERSFGILSIVLFALMTGASSTTVRASIMALIVIAARSSSRRYDISRALVAAAFLMVLHNPSILIFDISFQLSFLATLALVYVSPLITDRLGWVTERANLREIVSSTLATQAFVLPYLVYTMGQFSLISLVSNVLVLPVVPYAMFGGFVSSALGYISYVLALPIAWLSNIALSYILAVARMSSMVPFASIEMTASASALAVIYSLYIIFLVRTWRRRNSLSKVF